MYPTRPKAVGERSLGVSTVGKPAYITAIRAQHDGLLKKLHHKETGFRAISGIPHSLTYGDHVYLKGSDVAHSLRGYMGDTLFFNASLSSFFPRNNCVLDVFSVMFKISAIS